MSTTPDRLSPRGATSRANGGGLGLVPKTSPGTIRIGVSGWRYAGWRGKYYPPGLPQKDELAYLADRFHTVEINGTFYSLQRPSFFTRWAAATPADFVFTVKGPRFITHMKRLMDVRVPLANFFASGVLALGARLGPFLWQFPANFPRDLDRFRRFFELLPRDTEAASRLARSHDRRVSGRSLLSAKHCGPLRHAVEIRDPNLAVPDFVALSREHGVALVVADAVGWPQLMDVTADFVYCRLHGSEELYASGYEDAALRRWAARLSAWAAGGEPADAKRIAGPAPQGQPSRDVYLYFDNDRKVRAPFDAERLISVILEHPARAVRAG